MTKALSWEHPGAMGGPIRGLRGYTGRGGGWGREMETEIERDRERQREGRGDSRSEWADHAEGKGDRLMSTLKEVAGGVERYCSHQTKMTMAQTCRGSRRKRQTVTFRWTLRSH